MDSIDKVEELYQKKIITTPQKERIIENVLAGIIPDKSLVHRSVQKISAQFCVI